MSDKPSCGPLTDVVKTEGVRVARCQCGTYHVTFARTGVTLQLAPEYFGEVAQAFALAKSIASGPAPRPEPTQRAVPNGGFITLELSDPRKKPSN